MEKKYADLHTVFANICENIITFPKQNESFICEFIVHALPFSRDERRKQGKWRRSCGIAAVASSCPSSGCGSPRSSDPLSVAASGRQASEARSSHGSAHDDFTYLSLAPDSLLITFSFESLIAHRSGQKYYPGVRSLLRLDDQMNIF